MMGKKRPKLHYINSVAKRSKNGVLGPDMVGYLCTCNFHEQECVKEAYNILNEFADTLYGNEIIVGRSVTSGNRNDFPRNDTMPTPKPNRQRTDNTGSGRNFRGNDASTSDPTSSACIFVGNIQGDSIITRDDLKNYFSSFGIVLSVILHKYKSGKKSFAFIQFSDEEGAQNTFSIGKNVFIKGQQLDVGPIKRNDNVGSGQYFKAKDTSTSDPTTKDPTTSDPTTSDPTTSDPTTDNACIYVGNIQGDSITKDDLKNYFSSFGIVLSASLHKSIDGKKSFAFIQFSDEEGAQNTLIIGKNVFIKGQQLDVGPVKADQASIDISPRDSRQRQSFDGPSNQLGNRSFLSMESQPFSNASMGMGMGMGMGLNQMSSMSSLPVSQGMSIAKNLDPDRPNDAEIVVASVDQRSYAEYIKSHLLSLNMKADLLFPPRAGLSTSKIIGDLIKRQCLFAIMITEENEIHRSLSLHILYGQELQAHWDIPMANALKLVEENFLEYIQRMRGPQMMQQNMAPGDAAALGSKSGNVDVNEEEREKEENGKKTKDQEGSGSNPSKELDTVSTLSDSDKEPIYIEAAIKADVSVLKKSNEEMENNVQRFRQVYCAAKNVVFIQTTLEDPLPVSLAIMDDILQSQKQRTKKLLRMIPVQATCKAYLEDIEKTVKKLSSTYFKETSNTFMVVFKERDENDTINKETLILDLVEILQNANSQNKHVLNFPEVMLNVDVVQNVCCISLLPHYYTKYSKYNLVSLASQNKSLLNEDRSVKAEKEDNDVEAEKRRE